MECAFCKEILDERDILNKDTLHCWKCGTKRPLTKQELREYIYDTDDYTNSFDQSPHTWY